VRRPVAAASRDGKRHDADGRRVSDESGAGLQSELPYRNEDGEETMGKLIVTEFVTLDGVAQAPGGPEEDPDGGFPYGGWQAPFRDEKAGSAVFEQASKMDALLLGRRTYEIFAGYWPTAPEEIPFTGLLNRVPKYVASGTLSEPLAWQGSTLLAESVAERVTSLKERHGELHVIGSLNLVQSLLRSGLVDRLNLWLYPVLLGRGKHVFAEGTVPTALRLTGSVAYANGSLHLAYETTGAPTFGTM
jgi:dihydrofolate reductase